LPSIFCEIANGCIPFARFTNCRLIRLPRSPVTSRWRAFFIYKPIFFYTHRLDEPTTALDFENKTNIINIVKDLKDKLNINILFVTHDIESIKDICDDIVIIKNGYVVEFGKTQEVLNNPQNEYTKKLLNSSFKNKKFRN
jgi:ABC-type microcin C transport system duplicated ATPase subunit YejF